MKPSAFSAAFLAASFSLTTLAADPASDTDAQSESKKKEEIRGLILSDAQNQPAAKPASDDGRPGRNPAVSASPTAAATPAAETSAESAPPPPKPIDAPTSLLPKVEVNKSRITDLDLAIAEKQHAIDREKVNTKPTKLDTTLNNSAVAKTLSIFGGSSSEQRAGVAQERVQIMEEEKEILESMKTAQSKEERAELQQELDLLRQTRRELDQK